MFRKSAPRSVSLFALGFFITISVFMSLTASAQEKSPRNLSKPTAVAHKATPVADKAKLSAAMSRMPLAFETNSGQTDANVKFLSRGAGYTLFLTSDEAVLSLAAGKNSADVVRVKIAGANKKTQINALERLGWDSNYFVGNDRKKWRTHVANYRKVKFDEVYPGVQLVYYGNQNQLEHDFVVAPGADPKKIAMEIAGAKELVVDEHGNLVIKTNGGELRFEKPVVYQDVNGSRKEVAGNFVLRGKTVGFEVAAYDRSKALVIDPVINFGTLLSASLGVTAAGVAVDGAGNSYVMGSTAATSFPSPAPAPSLTGGGNSDVFVAKVSADGSSLGYVSFVGSSGNDSGLGIALDATNNAFITGFTPCTTPGVSTDFPTTANVFQPSSTCPGASAAFLTVLNPTGSGLVHSTLYGGDNNTIARAISVIGEQAFITGTTNSNATPLPTSGNAFSNALSGTSDAFLARIDTTSLPNTNGALCDGANNDTIDFGAAHAFIIGEQVTISGIVAAGATTFNTAPAHATITAVTPNTITYTDVSCVAADTGTGGTTTGGLAYGSYLGGAAGANDGRAIFAQDVNTVLVAGSTTSGTFPTTVGAAQTALSGTQDGFISSLDSVSGGLNASTFLGGSNIDVVNGIVVFNNAFVYAVGQTFSNDFPGVAGGVQNAIGDNPGPGPGDAFISELNLALTTVPVSSYLGGTGSDSALAISQGPAPGFFLWVVGSTTTPSVDGVFATNAISSNLSGTQDGFIAKFDTSLTNKSVATYFGGNGNSDGLAAVFATTAADTVVVAGTSDSTDLYMLGGTTGSAYQTVPASANPGGFVAKFSANQTALAPALVLGTTNSVDPLGFGVNNTDYTFTVTNNDGVNDAHNVTLDLHMDLNQLAINTITPIPAIGVTCVQGQANANSGITCDVGTLTAAGGFAKVTVNTQVTAAGACTGACTTSSITTNASVGAAEAGSNSSTTITSNVIPVTDVQVGVVSAVSDVSGAGLFVVQKDSALSYSYTITNAGASQAPNVTITNNLPAGFSATVVTLAITAGSGVTNCPVAPQAGTFTCSITGFTSGSTALMTLTGNPSSLLADAVAQTNNQLDFSASVAPSAASYIDSINGNDSGGIVGSVLERDTALTATLTDNGPVAPGASINFTATIKNGAAGANSDATNVQIDTTIDPTLPAIGAPVPTGITCGAPAGNAVTCGGTGTTITAGSTAVVAISTTAPAALVQPVVIDASPAGASRDGAGVVTVTITGGHPFAIGQAVEVASVTSVGGSNFNGRFTITGTTGTTFTYNQPAALGADTGGAGTAFIFGPQAVAASPAGAVRVAGVVNITTPAPHGFAAGQTVDVAGVTPVGATSFNGRFRIISSAGSSFTYAQKGIADDTGGGGTATIFMGSQFFHSFATLDTNPAGSSLNTPALPVNVETDTEVRVLTDLSIASFTAAPPALPVLAANTVSMTGPLTYTVGLNNSTTIAPNTAVRLTLTTGSNITSDAVVTGFTGADNCTANTGVGTTTQTVDCLINSVPVGASSFTVSIQPPVTLALSGGTVSDTLGANAVVSSDFVIDSTPANDSAGPVNFTVQRTADLDITAAGTGAAFAGAPGTVALSGTLTYTYKIKNNGPDTALNVNSVLALTPVAIATPLVVGSPTNATCVLNGTDIDCAVASLASGATVAITVPITPPVLTSMTGLSAIATDTLSAVANLGTQVSTSDTTAGNDTNGTTVNTTLRRTADVDVKTPTFNATSSAVAYAPNVAGTTITTNLTGAMKLNFGVKNIGPDTALNVPVLLTNVVAGGGSAPSGITSTPGSTCVASGNNIQCSVDSVASGSTSNITVTFTPSTPTAMTLGGGASPTGSFTSTAAVSPAPTSYFDGTAGNDANVQTVTTNLARQSDLQLTFAGNSFIGTPASVDLTAQLTFTYNFKNNGPDPALNTKSRLTFTSGPVTTPFAFGAAGSTFDIGAGPVALAAAANNGCVAVSSTQLDCEVDGPVPVGTSPGFVVKVTPPLTNFMNGGGASDAMTVGAQIGSTSVVDDAGAPAANNFSPFTVGISIQRLSDLAINSMTETPFTAAPASSGLGNPFVVTRDSTIHYDVQIQNNGPSDATNVVLTVNVAAGSTLPGGLPGACGAGSGFIGNTITCNYGALTVAAGAVPIAFVVTPPALAANSASTVLAGTASIGSTSVNDNTNTNNSRSAPTTQERDINLTIPGMTETPFTAAPASSGLSNPFVDTRDATIHYDLQIQNAGPSDATNIVLTVAVAPGSTLPGGLPGACGAGSGFAVNTITCNYGTLTIAAGAVPISFVVTPPALAANTALTVLPASATLNTNPLSANNLSGNSSNSASTTQERDVNLSIPTMTATPFTAVPAASGPNFVDTRDATIHYVLGLSNSGLSSANARLTVNIAAGSALNAPIPAGCALGGNTITCDIVVAAGVTPTYTFVVTPPVLTGASTLLQATANLVMTPGNAANNASSNSGNNVSITQERDADLGATFIQDPAQVQPVVIGPSFNNTVTWVAGVTNAGPSDANNVKVTDVLQQGLVFNLAATTTANGSGACTAVGSTVTCDFGTVAVGATPTLKIITNAGPTTLTNGAASGAIANSAAVASNTVIDPAPANNQSAAVNTSLIGEADINVVSIAGTPNPVLVGNNVTYTVTINNIGPHPSQPLTFNDTLPTGVSIVSASSPTFVCAGGVLPCTINSLAANTPTTVTVVGLVNAAAVPGPGLTQVLSDTAAVTFNVEDPTNANNSKTLNSSPTADAAADLQATQTTPAAKMFNVAIPFSVTVKNDNTTVRSTATGITVKNTVQVLPTDSVVTVTAPGCSFTAVVLGATTVSCNVANLTSGSSAASNFSITSSLPGKVTNVATVDPRVNPTVEIDPVAANDTTATVTVNVDNTPVCSGCVVTPVISAGLTNAGHSPLTGSQSATVQFTTVSVQGTTTLDLDTTSCAIPNAVAGVYSGAVSLATPPRPGTFVCGSGSPHPDLYKLATTATASGAVTVCFNYAGNTFFKPERVRLLQLSGNVATDITIASGFSPTTICGQLAGLGAGTTTLAVMEPSNAAPVANGTAVVTTNGTGLGTGLKVDLNATATTDADGPDRCSIGTGNCSDTLTYAWSSTAFVSSPVFGINPSVAIATTGTFNVILTVSDQLGAFTTKTFSLTATGGTGGTGTGGGTPTTSTINKGQSSSFTTTVNAPTGGTLTLTGSPSLATAQITCSVSPATLPASASPQGVTILCSTQGQIFGKLSPPYRGGEEAPLLAGLLGISSLPLLGMLLVPGKSRRRKLMRMWGIFGLMLLMVVFQAACGGSGGGFGGAPKLQNAGTPTGTYTLTLGLPAGATATVTDPTTVPPTLAPTTFTIVVQ